MLFLGIETSCDETAAAVGRGDRRAGAPVAHPRQRRRVAGRDPSRVGRRRARAGLAPARARHLRRRRAGARTGAASPSTRSTRLPSRRGRAWSGRCWSACRLPSRWPRRARSRSCPSTIWPATSSRCPCTTASCPCRRWCWWSRAGTPASTWCVSRALRAAGTHARRRGRGSLRQGRQAARPGLSRRPGHRPARARSGNDRAVDLPVTRITHRDRNAPDAPGTSDFSYSGLKTAVLRHVEQRKARGALAAA